MKLFIDGTQTGTTGGNYITELFITILDLGARDDTTDATSK